MTADLQPQSRPASRRALLAGALGGLGALAASALGRPDPARAANGDAITVGGTFTGTNATWLTNTESGDDVLHAYATGAGVAIYAQSDSYHGIYGYSATGYGVHGYSPPAAGVHGISNTGYGVHGNSSSGYGIFGDSPTGTGVVGSSTSNVGVYGISGASGVAAVIGRSDADGTGVEGYSGPGGPAAASQAKTGVYGYAVQDSSSKGVWGRTTSGHAIHGTATSGFAGYFAGKVYTSSFLEMTEITAPPAAAANKARLFIRDNGSGKSQVCVRFSSGGAVVIVTQP